MTKDREGNSFLDELMANQTRIVVFIKNGVQVHGIITKMYKDYMQVEHVVRQGVNTGGVDFIRYDAISTIHCESLRGM